MGIGEVPSVSGGAAADGMGGAWALWLRYVVLSVLEGGGVAKDYRPRQASQVGGDAILRN